MTGEGNGRRNKTDEIKRTDITKSKLKLQTTIIEKKKRVDRGSGSEEYAINN